MEIVDAQLHGNRLGAHWDAVPMEETLIRVVASMDALGIAAVVLDEYVSVDEARHVLPGELGADGYWRPRRPFSDLAVARYPSRFAYVSRMDRRDPALPRLMADLFSTPGLLGLRVHFGPSAVWADPDFASGGYNGFFAEAERHRVPLFMYVAPRIDLMRPYVGRFPDLSFVIDHFGAVRAPRDESPGDRYRRLDAVLALSDYPNVAVKWCHPERLAAAPYPFGDLLPHLRRMVDAFGADRVMWASDCTETMKPELSDHPSTWAESLFWVRDADLLSPAEKEWILGRTVRTVLHWPAS
jgi:L-fuconolactonase